MRKATDTSFIGNRFKSVAVPGSLARPLGGIGHPVWHLVVIQVVVGSIPTSHPKATTLLARGVATPELARSNWSGAPGRGKRACHAGPRWGVAVHSRGSGANPDPVPTEHAVPWLGPPALYSGKER